MKPPFLLPARQPHHLVNIMSLVSRVPINHYPQAVFGDALEIENAGEIRPTDAIYLATGQALQLDEIGSLMPSNTATTDEFLELDSNADWQPKE